jgi:type III restriction enzyme
MQRFLLGYPEVGSGQDADGDRCLGYAQALPGSCCNAAHRTTHKVAVPPDEVRKSGLLKDRILIHHPDFATTAEMALLEEAARRWGQMTCLGRVL